MNAAASTFVRFLADKGKLVPIYQLFLDRLKSAQPASPEDILADTFHEPISSVQGRFLLWFEAEERRNHKDDGSLEGVKADLELWSSKRLAKRIESVLPITGTIKGEPQRGGEELMQAASDLELALPAYGKSLRKYLKVVSEKKARAESYQAEEALMNHSRTVSSKLAALEELFKRGGNQISFPWPAVTAELMYSSRGTEGQSSPIHISEDFKQMVKTLSAVKLRAYSRQVSVDIAESSRNAGALKAGLTPTSFPGESDRDRAYPRPMRKNTTEQRPETSAEEAWGRYQQHGDPDR